MPWPSSRRARERQPSRLRHLRTPAKRGHVARSVDRHAKHDAVDGEQTEREGIEVGVHPCWRRQRNGHAERPQPGAEQQRARGEQVGDDPRGEPRKPARVDASGARLPPWPGAHREVGADGDHGRRAEPEGERRATRRRPGCAAGHVRERGRRDEHDEAVAQAVLRDGGGEESDHHRAGGDGQRELPAGSQGDAEVLVEGRDTEALKESERGAEHDGSPPQLCPAVAIEALAAQRGDHGGDELHDDECRHPGHEAQHEQAHRRDRVAHLGAPRDLVDVDARQRREACPQHVAGSAEQRHDEPPPGAHRTWVLGRQACGHPAPRRDDEFAVGASRAALAACRAASACHSPARTTNIAARYHRPPGRGRWRDRPQGDDPPGRPKRARPERPRRAPRHARRRAPSLLARSWDAARRRTTHDARLPRCRGEAERAARACGGVQAARRARLAVLGGDASRPM